MVLSWAYVPFAQASTFPFGDLDDDNLIDIKDALLVRDYLLGRSPEFDRLLEADFNQDGYVDVTDIVSILKYDGDWDGDGVLDGDDSYPLDPNKSRGSGIPANDEGVIPLRN